MFMELPAYHCVIISRFSSPPQMKVTPSRSPWLASLSQVRSFLCLFFMEEEDDDEEAGFVSRD